MPVVDVGLGLDDDPPIAGTIPVRRPIRRMAASSRAVAVLPPGSLTPGWRRPPLARVAGLSRVSSSAGCRPYRVGRGTKVT